MVNNNLKLFTMKKVLLSLFAVGYTLTQLVAQETTFEKGSKVLNLGVGLGSPWYHGSYYKSQVPPVSASFEVGVVDNILEKGVLGVGGYLGYSSYKSDYGDYGWKSTNLFIGARGNFHYPLVNKLDTYVGLTIGYNVVSDKGWGNYGGYDYGSSWGGIRTAEFIGARYYFSEKFAAMLELGYGVTYLNLGIALKL
jgi:hypothetical protein